MTAARPLPLAASDRAGLGRPSPAGPAGALSGPLSERAVGTACAIALAAHVLLVATVLLLSRVRSTPEEAPVRLVFVEPAPPPAAPLGAPDGTGHAPVATAPSDLALPNDPVPASEVPPASVEAEPLRHIAAKPAEDARRQPRERPESPPTKRAAARSAAAKPEPAPAGAVPPAPARGVAEGSLDGRAGGVVGGVAGGIEGGVVGARGSGPVRLDQVANAPVLLRRVEPDYPQVARRRRIEGLVLLEAILDREGRVEPSVRVVRSIPALDASALAAVKQWRFRPARSRDGAAVRVILEIPIRFVLN